MIKSTHDKSENLVQRIELDVLLLLQELECLLDVDRGIGILDMNVRVVRVHGSEMLPSISMVRLLFSPWLRKACTLSCCWSSSAAVLGSLSRMGPAPTIAAVGLPSAPSAVPPRTSVELPSRTELRSLDIIRPLDFDRAGVRSCSWSRRRRLPFALPLRLHRRCR